MPQDLADAIFQTLRNSQQITQAFGDTWDMQLTATENTMAGNVCKFWADYAAEVQLPYLVEFEPRETYQNMTQAPSGAVSYIGDGQFVLSIQHTGRQLARELGDLAIFVLEDAPIAWPDVKPMNCRINMASFVPRPGIGPDSPTVFQRVLTFDYEFSGSRFFPPTGGIP